MGHFHCKISSKQQTPDNAEEFAKTIHFSIPPAGILVAQAEVKWDAIEWTKTHRIYKRGWNEFVLLWKTLIDLLPDENEYVLVVTREWAGLNRKWIGEVVKTE